VYSDDWDPDLNPRVSRADYLDLQAEAEASWEHSSKWQERGPPGPHEGGPQTWRGQRYRPQTGKWMNRGGANRDWHSAFFSYINNKKKVVGNNITPAMKKEAREYADEKCGPRQQPKEEEENVYIK